MNWYIAKLVYQVIYGNGIFDAQFCEQLRLVEASDELHAFTRAQLLGHTEETVLYSQNEALVQWKFINVCELILLNDLADGAEIQSQLTEPGHAKAFIKTVQRQASQLLEESCNKCLY